MRPGNLWPEQPPRIARACLAAFLIWLAAGCGTARQTGTAGSQIPAALLREARPIGRGPRFHPPLRGRITGRCQHHLGPRYGVHVEIFGANRVVILPAGIGTRPPLRLVEGRIFAARCFGSLVTLEPTGLVLVRPGTAPTMAGLFQAWGQPLSSRRLDGFTAAGHHRVRVFIDGRRRNVAPGSVHLMRHAEIVLELGPYVPPHRSYTFPPGT